MVRKLRRTFGWRSPKVLDYLRDNWPSRVIPGLGRVDAGLTTARTVGHIGTMSMFRNPSFDVTSLDEHQSTDDPRYPGRHVVMRLEVGS